MTPQIRLPDLPQGFRTLSVDGATLIARDELMTPLTAAGLQTPEGWQRQLQARSSGPGRGAVQLLKVPGGALVLKQMRRGGSLARLWRDRYSGVGRLWDNLVVPLRVHERGIEPLLLPRC